MPVSTLPDVAGAIRALILAQSAVTALVGQKVAIGALNKTWDMPIQCVVLNETGGPLGLEDGGLRRQRLDIWCYGATLQEAAALWRALDPRLCSRQDGAAYYAAAFQCYVADIARESEMRRGIERDTQFPRAACSYLVLYSEAPR